MKTNMQISGNVLTNSLDSMTHKTRISLQYDIFESSLLSKSNK